MSLHISKKTSTAAKGIFCLIVILSHTYGYLMSGGFGSVINALCKIAMFGFLFLSGYGCHRSWISKGLDGFWERKILKLYIPAMLAGAISVVIYFMFGYRVGRGEIFDAIVTVNPDFADNGSWWYMRYLLLWYMIFWLINRLITDIRIKNVMYGAALLVAWYICPQVEHFMAANPYGFAYVFGIWYSQIADRFKEVPKNAIIGVATAVISIAVIWLMVHINGNYIFNVYVGFWVRTFITNVLCLFGMILLLMICSRLARIRLVRGGILWIGNISYITYILHPPLLLFPLFELNGSVNPWIVFIIGMAACLLTASVYTYKIEGLFK